MFFFLCYSFLRCAHSVVKGLLAYLDDFPTMRTFELIEFLSTILVEEIYHLATNNICNPL